MSIALPSDDERRPVRWLTVEQLMEIIPLKKSRVYYLVHVGQIPHYKLGQSLFFREDEILGWMEGNRWE